MRRNRLVLFSTVFMKLAAVESARSKDFMKVFGVLETFANQHLGKEIIDLNFFGDLVLKGGKVNPELCNFVEKFYENESTRVSQLNRLENLIAAELRHYVSAGEVTPELVSAGLVKAENLPAHLREIWLALPRKRGEGQLSPERREKLPLTPVGMEVFRALLSVNEQYGVQDAATLLDELQHVVRLFIGSNVHHKIRRRARTCFNRLRNGFDFRRPTTEYTEADLPPKIRKCVQVFRSRAPHGFAPYPELRAQSEKYKGYKDGQLAGRTIRRYVWNFIYGLSKLNLSEDACIQDLLVLDSRPIERDGKVIGIEYFNPLLEPYAAAERARSKPDWKQENFDSVMYLRFLEALFSIARYNGEFDLPMEFRRRVELRRDNKTRKERKRKKKQRFSRKWVDEQILLLKREFDRAIKKKTFLDNQRPLKVCIFLPQLVVMRYLGYRQQCLRRCLIGRNIKFGKDGSVSFYYARNEIKNEVIIDQTFTADSCSEMPGLLLMLDVLRQYHRVFLPTVRAHSPKYFDEQMGRMFFAIPSKDGIGLIKKAPADVTSQSTREAEGDDGCSDFNYWFSRMAYELMNFDDLTDFPHDFNPHLLRGHCCDWLRKVLEWSWEDVSKAMGDREETLKKEYFEEDDREQSEAPFVRYNERLRAEREHKERAANSVPVEALNKMQAALGDVSDQLREERALRKRAEDEARTYRRHYEFVLSMANITDGEVRARLLGEPAYA